MAVLELNPLPRKLGRPPLHSRILPHSNLGRNLTTCYLFNSAPSNYLIDSSPFRHDSETIQNPTDDYWLPTDDGKALFLFEAAAQRIDCGHIPKLNGSSQATLSVLIKRASLSSRASVGKGGFNLDVLDSSFTYLGMDGVYGRFVNNESSPQWQHIVFTFDGSKSVNSERLTGYKNGIRQTLDINGTLPDAISVDSFNLFYINYSTEFGVYGSSYYKFVGVWNRALSPREVMNLYEDQDYSWLTQRKTIYKPFNLVPAPQVDVPLTGDPDAQFSLELTNSCGFTLGCSTSLSYTLGAL